MLSAETESIRQDQLNRNARLNLSEAHPFVVKQNVAKMNESISADLATAGYQLLSTLEKCNMR